MTLLLLQMAVARENPFKPLVGETALPVTSNKSVTTPSLKRVVVSLPSEARVLKSLTIRYQTLDGAIHTKTVSVDQAVDWHHPLIVSQSQTPSAGHAHGHAMMPFAPFSFVSVRFGRRSFHIVTHDEKIRTFHMSNPFKIVFDFRRNVSFSTLKKALSKAPFQKVEIGNHDGYYRIVVTFDAPYRYTITPTDDGYLVTLR